jgi:hypothetical protein
VRHARFFSHLASSEQALLADVSARAVRACAFQVSFPVVGDADGASLVRSRRRGSSGGVCIKRSHHANSG